MCDEFLFTQFSTANTRLPVVIKELIFELITFTTITVFPCFRPTLTAAAEKGKENAL